MPEVRDWFCRKCGWSGAEPSISDASYVRMGYQGELIHDRVHIACCPLCFEAVRRDERLPTGTYRRITEAA